MSKGKPAKGKKAAAQAEAATKAPAAGDPFAEQVVIGSGNLALHDLFQQQALRMLERTDLDEEEKQQILLAMACPCCGAGAMSYTVKLKK